jgi:hypothetical protein
MQTLLLLAAPPMISATVYRSLGRLIRHLDARGNASMSPRAMTPIFVLGDLVAFFSQVIGAGMQAAQSQSIPAIGRKVVLAGLIFQVLLFTYFIWNIGIFHKRNSASPTLLSHHPQVPNWRRRIWALYFASVCILVRNIVRIAEYAEGGKGDIAKHEVFIYLFDGTPMWLAMAVFMICHPGRLFKKARIVATAMQKNAEESIPTTGPMSARQGSA